ncbi:MAG: hypothetical protein N4A37_09895 [Prolixibacteraceae bacterium]|jgi:hypothetical protein|nr:hypothetical protein [Prolixibacteraceae bacterium]
MITLHQIEKYIAFRYPNWRERAIQLSKEHNFEGWEDDLLQMVIMDLLQKSEDLLFKLYKIETTKIVNGKPTRELDKYVLHMLRVNAFSTKGRFRTQVLGERSSNYEGENIMNHSVGLDEIEYSISDEDDSPSEERKTLRCIHAQIIKRMRSHKVIPLLIEVYRFRCIQGSGWSYWTKSSTKEAKEIESQCRRYAKSLGHRGEEKKVLQYFIHRGWIKPQNLTLF